MRADIDESGLDFGNAVRVLCGLGFRQQRIALAMSP